MLLTVLQVALVSLDPTGSGKFVLSFEPKHCVTDPCPQFRVEKLNGKVSGEVGADLINAKDGKAFDSDGAGLKPTGCVQVVGDWTTPNPKRSTYIEISYSKEPKVLSKKKAPCH